MSRTSDNKKSSKEREELLEKVGKIVVPQIALQLLRDERISIRGKTEDQVETELIALLKSELSRINFAATVDHAASLLPEARKFLREGKTELSALYFATYFEHRLNWLIVQICQSKQIDERTIRQLLRETSIRAKCTWVMVLLGHQPFSKEKLTDIEAIGGNSERLYPLQMANGIDGQRVTKGVRANFGQAYESRGDR